ncbi:MAG: glycosyltransferase family 2 protein, partial [Pseudomonadota bacterium]
MPRVSVVMPAYRVGKTIKAAVCSVLHQSYDDFELLVVNDGCPSGSGVLALEFGDARVRVIEQSNRGLAGARNTGIAHAQGDYVALLDGDDRWHPHKLKHHVALLDAHPTVGVSYSASALIDDAGRRLNLTQQPKLRKVTERDVFCRNPVGNGSAAVVRREVFDDIAFVAMEAGGLNYFDESFRQSEDIECWTRIALTTNWEFRGIGLPLTDYRVCADGLSADVIQQFASWQRMVEVARDIDPAFVQRYGHIAQAYQLRYLARRLVRMGDGAFACQLMLDALKSHPRMCLEEPRKTATTVAATLLLRGLGETRYAVLERLAR